MNDCDALLREVIGQAKALAIPIAKSIEPNVRINRRAVSRFGCCRRSGEVFVIEVAARVAEGNAEGCREVLAHELLHTCFGCQNHGKRWKSYAQRMNEAYGYNIRRTATDRDVGAAVQTRPYQYILRCEKCGAELGRFRASPLTRHPERYRCRCGGRLTRIHP